MSVENYDYQTPHLFVEGEHVKIARDDYFLGIPPGSIGVVLWDLGRKLYEVTFTDSEGLIFDSMYSEDELSKVELEAV